MLLKRKIESELKSAAKQLPVVGIFGPRQSGKTTLAQEVFARHKYVSLEEGDIRRMALEDPRQFLDDLRNDVGVVIDEAQYAPDLFSYIQTDVDKHNKPGYYVLTGSQNYLLNQSISQSLAGRIAIITLLPLSINELKTANLLSSDLNELLFKGMYPRVLAQNVLPRTFYSSYVQTYVERDVRQIKNVTDLNAFQHFIKLCAGRVGQILNYSGLGSDCGVTTNTIKSWISLLESSYIIFLLQPHYKQLSRRLIKAPKLYFYDTGLACFLLDIDDVDKLKTHYARGNLFESFVIAEFFKYRYNQSRRPNIYFWRDSHGHEIDGIIENGTALTPIEIKMGKTIAADWFDGLNYWNDLSKADPAKGFIVYGGEENYRRKTGRIVGWQSLSDVFD